MVRSLSLVESLPAVTFNYIAELSSRCNNENGAKAVQLMRVCPAWRILGEDMLYSHIDLNVERNTKFPSGMENVKKRRQEQVGLLCRTLQERPSLANHVRKLAVYLPRDSRECIGIIALCQNIRHLTISGRIPDSHTTFITAIMRLDLRFFKFEHSEIESYHLFEDMDEIIRLSRCWPSINTMIVKRAVPECCFVGQKPIFKSLSGIWLSRPAYTTLPLEELDLIDAWSMDANGFDSLRSLSLPLLRKFSAHVSGKEGTDAALVRFLDSLDPRLNALKLYKNKMTDRDSFRKAQLAESFKRFTSLRTFQISSRMLAPEDLLSLSSLTSVTYDCYSSHIEPLALGLEEKIMIKQALWPKNVPDLKTLTLIRGPIVGTRNAKELIPEVGRLIVVCSARDICVDNRSESKRPTEVCGSYDYEDFVDWKDLVDLRNKDISY